MHDRLNLGSGLKHALALVAEPQTGGDADEAAPKDSNNDKPPEQQNTTSSTARGEIDVGKVGDGQKSAIIIIIIIIMIMTIWIILNPLLVLLLLLLLLLRCQVQEYLSNNNTTSSNSKKPLSSLQIKTAAATALATAAIKAKLLADQEAREIQRLASTVVELQLKKANIKLRRFQLLEEVGRIGSSIT